MSRFLPAVVVESLSCYEAAEQLANGPKPAVQIKAAAEEAEIPAQSLIVAADALEVYAARAVVAAGTKEF